MPPPAAPPLPPSLPPPSFPPPPLPPRAYTCADVYDNIPGSTTNGVYTIFPPNADSAFEVYCDMEDSKGPWTLVGITNNQNTNSPTDYDAVVLSQYVGNYAKPLKGASGTASKLDCGSSGGGASGYQINSGTWTWDGTYISANLPTLEDDVTWPADVPGYNSGAADTLFHNHVSGVHFPNFGATGWPGILTNPGFTYTWFNARGAFTCNPQASSFGNGDIAWGSYSGTRFVRYWLK